MLAIWISWVVPWKVVNEGIVTALCAPKYGNYWHVWTGSAAIELFLGLVLQNMHWTLQEAEVALRTVKYRTHSLALMGELSPLWS